jgi:diguanylate cyclase
VLVEPLKPHPPRAPTPSLDDEEKAWRALEEVLRRLVGHLCVAARGQSTQLDAQLGRVASALRRRAPAPEVEGLLGDLHRAIVALDDAPRVEQRGAGPSAAFAMAAGYLTRLLERLALEPRVASRVDEIKALLAAAASDAAVAEAIERMADVVNEQLQALQRDRGEVERTLAHVNSQLDEVAAYLCGEDADREAAQRSSQQMEGQVRGELAGLGDSVRAAQDLEALRRDVLARTEAIHQHVVEFREREATRLAAWQDRADRMRARIADLESQTRALQDSLRREKRLSTTDALTGIPNRLAWDERIAHEFARWKRFRRPMCLAAWDIDHFKAINDSYGHAAGDKVLYVVAQHLARHVREVDFVARYGGEEFAMLLIGTGPEDALRVCNGLRERIARLNFHYRQKPIPVTVSCGIAVFDGEDTPESVFERADLAMYRAKHEGRNACVLG